MSLSSRRMTWVAAAGRSVPSSGLSQTLDTFTDAPTTNLESHTPDEDPVGGGWFNIVGVHRIATDGVGAIAATLVANVAHSVIETNFADAFALTGTWFQHASERRYHRWPVRSNAAGTDYYQAMFLVLASSAVRLYVQRYASGVVAETEFTEFGAVATQEYNATVTVNDDSITHAVTGVGSHEKTDATMHKTQKHCGIGYQQPSAVGVGNQEARSFQVAAL